MKKIWNSFLVAFAMYSRIPMPRADWTAENMKYSMCFFPCIGLCIGAAEYLWYCLSRYLGFNDLFRAAVMTLLPVLITGGIHVDGYLDTMDALSSWREKERRLEILKDPHAGAFAIIMGCVWFLLYFGAASEVSRGGLVVYCLSFVVSRCFSALSVLFFHNANPKGSAAAFSGRAQKRASGLAAGALLAAAAAAAVIAAPAAGGAAVGTALLVFVYYRYKSEKYFGGITGDLAGYFLCLCELFMLLAVVLAQ